MNKYRDTIVPLAKAMGLSDYAIEKWRHRGHVPHRHRLPLIEAARAVRKRLAPADFEGLNADVQPRGKKENAA